MKFLKISQLLGIKRESSKDHFLHFYISFIHAENFIEIGWCGNKQPTSKDVRVFKIIAASGR